MDSDFPEFDEVYYKVLLPENPNKFDIMAAKSNFNIYHHDLWIGTGKRFAEMIVNECIKACPHEDGRNHIRKYFEVELNEPEN